MLGRLLLIVGSMVVASEIHKLFGQKSRKSVKKKAKSCRRIGDEDRISALPNDLLMRILLLVPTKDAVTTMILSKRWQLIWTMLPVLEYYEIKDGTHKNFLGRLLSLFCGKREQQKSIWRFLNESLRLHKALVLEKLVIELGKQCPVDADVRKWIAYAADRRVRHLWFELMWSAEPTSLPESLYICDSLVYLALSEKIFVDVPSSVCLPSLKTLYLYSVVYKDDDSIARLLASCPILKHLSVRRQQDRDNLRNFSVNVPSLETLEYYVEPRRIIHNEEDLDNIGGSLVIVSAILKEIFIVDGSGDSCLIENKPRLDVASLYVFCYLDENFMRSLSSVTYLELFLGNAMVTCCETINFSQLIQCNIRPYELDWFEAFVFFLHNSPKLKALLIDQTFFPTKDFPLSFNQPSSVPGCLSTKLKIFEWKEYGGTTEEKEIVRYIFANSKCLKRVGISLRSTCNPKDKEKMMEELKSMSRISTSSRLLFSTQLKFMPSIQLKSY